MARKIGVDGSPGVLPAQNVGEAEPVGSTPNPTSSQTLIEPDAPRNVDRRQVQATRAKAAAGTAYWVAQGLTELSADLEGPEPTKLWSRMRSVQHSVEQLQTMMGDLEVNALSDVRDAAELFDATFAALEPKPRSLVLAANDLRSVLADIGVLPAWQYPMFQIVGQYLKGLATGVALMTGAMAGSAHRSPRGQRHEPDNVEKRLPADQDPRRDVSVLKQYGLEVDPDRFAEDPIGALEEALEKWEAQGPPPIEVGEAGPGEIADDLHYDDRAPPEDGPAEIADDLHLNDATPEVDAIDEAKAKPELRGTVAASVLNLRASPNGDATIEGKLPRNTEVKILSEADGWMKVDTPKGTGFVAARFIRQRAADAKDEVRSTPSRKDVAAEGKITVKGKRVLVDGQRFARVFRKGLFHGGHTSIAGFLENAGDRVDDLAPSRLRVLGAVSENEGKLEAVNTWDNAFLSFGAMQWTVGTKSASGELAGLLYRLKNMDADVYDKYFGQFGLEVVDTKPKKGRLTRGRFALDGKKLLKSADKNKHLRTHRWAHRFYLAGKDDTVREAQIRHAAERMDVILATKVAGKTVGDWVTSERAVAQILDHHVNRPGHVAKVLSLAVKKVKKNNDLPANPADWNDTHEEQLVETYLAIRHVFGGRGKMTDSKDRARRVDRRVETQEISGARNSYKPEIEEPSA